MKPSWNIDNNIRKCYYPTILTKEPNTDFVKDLEKISIIVPTLNEAGNVQKLTERIDSAFAGDRSSYEIIFIDDHSSDGTLTVLQGLSRRYPVSFYLKHGNRGKAYSLIEGFGHAKYGISAFIDADLQYPPEAIPDMAMRILAGEADVVVANRISRKESAMRNFASKGFAFFFGRILHGLSCDVQSGLKVFKTRIIKEITLNPSGWTFDLEFLLNARDAGYNIGGKNIEFAERTYGESKVNFLKTIYEIGGNALAMRFRKKKVFTIPPSGEAGMIGSGVAYNGKRFITHTQLSNSVSAFSTFAKWQKIFLFSAFLLLAAGFYVFPLQTAIFLIGGLSIFYFIDSIFNFYLVSRSLRNPSELHFSESEIAALDDGELPVYSILCPLYRESEVLPGFLESIEKLDWPKEKLDVLLLLEENDAETISAARRMDLPEYVRTIIVPHGLPKTKPKACNYGLSLVRGEYVVVYDAEDNPESKQLKKAYLGFARLPKTVKCLQAKLNYHNSGQNMMTRLFTAEYSLWFEVMLPALQSLNTFIPLGGTSNHFRSKDILDLKGWDPFNVTEDCDLGARLFKLGSKTAIIDSTTLEEANSQVGNWIRQRSRWIKGYLQTYLVHTRHPLEFIKKSGVHALMFQLSVGIKTTFALLNPLLWLATILYFTMRSTLGPAIEAMYPSPIFYMAVFSLVFGNFMYLYNYMIGLAKREEWHLIKYVFFIPFYWLLMSIAAYMAVWQLFFKPHFWEKTRHGLGLAPKNIPETIPVPEEALPAEAPSISRLRSAFASYIPESFSGSVVSGGMVLMSAMMVANVINFLFNAFLGRVLSLEEFGLVTLVNTILSLVGVLFNAFSNTVNRESAYLSVSVEKQGTAFLKFALKRGLFAAAAISAVWIAASPLVSQFFNISDPKVILLFTPVFLLGTIGAASRGYLNGNLYFKFIGFVILFEALAKFFAAFVFWQMELPHLVYLSIPISIVVATALSVLAISKRLSQKEAAYSGNFPLNFFSASLVNTVAISAFLSLDIILAKHFLSSEIAGEYALLSLAGKIIYFLGSLPKPFITTLVSRDEGKHKDPQKTFGFIFAAVSVLSILGFIFVGPLGNITVTLLFGAKTLPILPYLSIYSFAMMAFTVSNAIVLYYLARGRYIFSFIPALTALVMIGNIILHHANIADIVNAIFFASAAGFGSTILLSILEPKLRYALRAASDLVKAFTRRASLEEGFDEKEKILIFNWRDTKHVFAGGAEVYVHEMAKEWAKEGWAVTLFCGNDGNNSEREMIDGVEVIRRGGFYFVYLWAFVYYFAQFRGKYDVIIDCHNGVPFFTPFYAKEPVFCLMHHVHQEIFTRYLSRPLAMFARFLEKGLMPLVYRNTKFITVSNSSKWDIEELGLGRAGIEVVHPGVDLEALSVGEKSKTPTVLYLGRLKAYKSIDVLIGAFRKVLEAAPEAKLIVAGSGEEDKNLRRHAENLGIARSIEFRGFVNEDDKLSLLQKAWVMVNPSIMEGWGITTIEANACGTPVVASNVPGLRDSIKNPHTGYLVKYGDEDAFAERIISIIKNKELREKMNEEAVKWASNFGWKKTSESFMSAISDNFEAES